MSDFNLSALNIDPIPYDAYLKLAKWSANNDDGYLLDRNMGAYFDAFESVFDSRVETEQFTIALWAKMYANQYPRLMRILYTYSSAGLNSRLMLSTEVYNAERQRLATEYLRVIHELRLTAANYRRVQASMFAVFVEEPEEYKESDLASFYTNNIAGWHKQKQKQALEPAIQIIKLAMPIMDAWCAMNGAEFTLRPMLAFNGPFTDSLFESKNSIYGRHTYYSKAQSLVEDALLAIDSSMFGRYFAPGANLAADKRDVFHKWQNTTALASLDFNLGGTRLLLTPRNIPSVLLAPHHTTLPVVFATYESGMIEDQIAQVGYLHEEQIELLDFPIFRNSMTAIGRLMALICFAASVVSANTKVGSGSHRPYWIHTPLNARTMQVMLELAPVILRNAQEEINYEAAVL